MAIMNLTESSNNPLVVDHDSRKLTIIFGILGTLIAFSAFTFAILSWYWSRRQKCTGHGTTPTELELEDGRPGDAAHACQTRNFRGPENAVKGLGSKPTIDDRYLKTMLKGKGSWACTHFL